MKSPWKQSSGLPCADAGPLSPLGGRSRRRARLTAYGFAVAFAAFTAYVAFATPPAAAGAGASGGASWFGGVYASTAPYRSQVSTFFSSIFPADSPATSPEQRARAAGGSSGGGGVVSRDANTSSVQLGSAAGSNGSATAASGKHLETGGGAPISNAGVGSVPPAGDLAGTNIGGNGGGVPPANTSASSGGSSSDPVDRNKGSDGGASSSPAGGGSGSPASSSAGNGTVAKTAEDSSNAQTASASGAPSNDATGPAGHGGTAKTEAKAAAQIVTNTSAGNGNSAETDLGTGSSSDQGASVSGVPSSGSAAGNSSSVKADAEVAVGSPSNSSAGNDTDTKANLGKGSDAQSGGGSGDASQKSAGSSSPAKSNAGEGEIDGSSGSESAAPTTNQAESPAMAGDKGGSASKNNNTVVASPPLKNQEQASGSEVASDGSSSTVNNHKVAAPRGSADSSRDHATVNNQKGAAPQGSAASSKDQSAQAVASKSGNNGKGGESSTLPRGSFGNKEVDWFNETANCDMFHGSWVRDDSYPLYPEGSCPHIDEPFDCYLNGRRDLAYQKLRWQPSGCSIPRLNPTDMLERLRGKRLVFVGDSLNRNMWESLVCILRNSVKDKRKVFEASGRREFKTEGSYSFVFKDYNCSVEFFRSPFLVQEWEMQVSNGKKKETLRLDLVEQSSPKYKDADFLIFNTGHWWTHEKTALGKDYYQEGNHVYSELNVVDAFHKALVTWSKWIDANVNPRKTTVLFRGYSASHFGGGQWNSGGSCDKESEPIANEQYLSTYPPKMSILEDVIHKMKTPVVYLNITRMTDYRKDAHPSIFRKQNLTDEERRSPERYQDCSHWCLPGVPDSWNELVYAQLLIKQHQMLLQ